MSDALADKRTATRLRVLVEIADRQPAVSQGEIADAVGVTSQAVSEYIRELVDDDLVTKEGRSRYSVTKEGVDWLFQEAKSLQRYADHVTSDVLGSVQEDTAIATDSIEAGQVVTISVQDGLLHASPGESGPATGVATTDAEAGTDVSVTSFEGVIDMSTGTVTVAQIPPTRDGGSRVVDTDHLAELCDAVDLTVAAGVEAVVSLHAIDRDAAVTVAAGEVAAAAAAVGETVVVVASTDTIGRVTDALRDGNVSYEVTSPVST
jgi:putative transcriptional regulator